MRQVLHVFIHSPLVDRFFGGLSSTPAPVDAHVELVLVGDGSRSHTIDTSASSLKAIVTTIATSRVHGVKNESIRTRKNCYYYS